MKENAKTAGKLNICTPASDAGKGDNFSIRQVRNRHGAVRAFFANPFTKPGVPDEIKDESVWLHDAMPSFSDLEGGFQGVGWLWRNWLPRGEFVVLAGAPGAGKTTVAVSMAANVSTGSFPAGDFGKPHNVLFLRARIPAGALSCPDWWQPAQT